MTTRIFKPIGKTPWLILAFIAFALALFAGARKTFPKYWQDISQEIYFSESFVVAIQAAEELEINSIGTEIEVVRGSQSNTVIYFQGWATPHIDDQRQFHPWVHSKTSYGQSIGFDQSTARHGFIHIDLHERGDDPRPQVVRVELGQVLPAKLHVRSVSGDLDFKVDGLKYVHLATTSGDLNSEGNLGELILSSVSGEVSTLVSAHKLDIDSTSGDLNILYRAHTGPARIKTVSGDVTLTVAGIEKPHFSVRTVSGSLKNDGYFKVQNNTSPTDGISIETVSGDVTLKSSDSSTL